MLRRATCRRQKLAVLTGIRQRWIERRQSASLFWTMSRKRMQHHGCRQRLCAKLRRRHIQRVGTRVPLKDVVCDRFASDGIKPDAVGLILQRKRSLDRCRQAIRFDEKDIKSDRCLHQQRLIAAANADRLAGD